MVLLTVLILKLGNENDFMWSSHFTVRQTAAVHKLHLVKQGGHNNLHLLSILLSHWYRRLVVTVATLRHHNKLLYYYYY